MKRTLPVGVVVLAISMGCMLMTDSTDFSEETLGPEDLFVEVEPQSRGLLLEHWRWKVGQEAKILRVTVFGDLFLEDAEGRVYFLDTGSARYLEVAKGRDEWAEAAEIHGPEWFHLNALQELRARRVALEKGDVFSWRQYPMLGGPQSADNVDMVSLEVHISHSGRVAKSLQDVPPGAEIGSVDFEVLGPREGDRKIEGRGEDMTVYEVVVNEELQYSIWPVGEEIPIGWRNEGKTGTKGECLRYIAEVWTDMRPLSLRRQQRDDSL